MKYWVNIYEGGHPGAWWDSLRGAIEAAGGVGGYGNVMPVYRIKVTLKGKA